MRGLYFFALAATVACASGPSNRRAVYTGSDRNVITEEEIRSVPASNLYDLVSKLRPQMLQSRGQSTLGGSTASDYATVYVDGRQFGDIASLRSLIPSQVSSVKYYDPTMAAARFGTTAGSGVIDVTTRQ